MRVEGGVITGKFGGTSMANYNRMENAADIVCRDPNRSVTVVSAPGNGDRENPLESFRVTLALRGKDFNPVWQRFDTIARDLFGRDERYARVTEAIDESRRGVESGDDAYSESRGEYLSGKVFAELLGATFVDPKDMIKLGSDGSIHQDTYKLVPQYLSKGGIYVVPGYYGANVDTGEIQLLPPGGSDLTGAILAKGVGATVYENWTDVDGVLAADPRIVQNPKGIKELTHNEMGELAHRGFNVLQVDAIEPVMDARILVNLRNSLNPNHPGTMVVDQRISSPGEQIIGIASREGFVSFEIAKSGMAQKPGALAQITGIFARNDISLEQGPGGRNHVSVITHSDQLHNGAAQEVMREIYSEVQPDKVSLSDNIGLVAVVGQRIGDDATHINAAMYPALSDANIRTGAHIQSAEPNSIVMSVYNRDVKRTVNVLYDALI